MCHCVGRFTAPGLHDKAKIISNDMTVIALVWMNITCPRPSMVAAAILQHHNKSANDRGQPEELVLPTHILFGRYSIALVTQFYPTMHDVAHAELYALWLSCGTAWPAFCIWQDERVHVEYWWTMSRNISLDDILDTKSMLRLIKCCPCGFLKCLVFNIILMRIELTT